MDASIRNNQGLGQGVLGGTANPSHGMFTTGGGGFTTGKSKHALQVVEEVV
jgi:hypothetical protein